MTSAELFARARPLFEEAVELEGETRAAFLDKACGDDRDLREEVESLLAADARAESEPNALDLGPGPLVVQRDLTTVQIGPYRLLEQLGSGGMGTVYLAEQSEPKRRVALKLLHFGLRDEASVRRFRYEAETLARLEHPYIARVYSTGTHRDPTTGLELPYLAMEFVEQGQDLCRSAQIRQLETRDRIHLFRKVCAAVQHGHQKGIIHRDLKPANLLVDRSGNPKVIDFGIALSTEERAELTERMTATGQLLGTLDYMSPEQFRSSDRDVDVRADVYALGVVLFELLSGGLPFDLGGRNILQAAEIVSGRAPRRMSELRRRLRGDLDTIVQKALEREPARRYQSVAELDADLEAFLDDRPIGARPPSSLYQVRKFAARHRVPVLATALLVGLAVTASLMILAKNRSLRAERDLVAASERRLRATNERLEAARSELVRSFEELDREKDRAELAADQARATASLFREVLTGANPMSTGRGDTTIAAALDEAAAQLDLRASASKPGDQTIGQRLGPKVEFEIRETLADIYRELSLYPQAANQAERAAQLLAPQASTAGAAEPAVTATLAQIARLEIVRALIELERGEAGGAESRLLDLSRRLDESKDVPETLRLSVEHNLAKTELELGRLDDAAARYRRVFERRRELLGPSDPRTLITLHNLGRTELNRHHLDEAETALTEALDRRREVLGDDHPDVWITADVLGELWATRGDFESAEAQHREAWTALTRILGPAHDHSLAAAFHLAKVLARTGRGEELAEVVGEAHEAAAATFGPRHFKTLRLLTMRASAAVMTGDLDEGLELFREIHRETERALGPEHEDTLVAATNLCYWLARSEQTAAAHSFLEPIAVRMPPPSVRSGRAEVTVATMLSRLCGELGQVNASRRWMIDAIERADRFYGSDSSQSAELRAELRSLQDG